MSLALVLSLMGGLRAEGSGLENIAAAQMIERVAPDASETSARESAPQQPSVLGSRLSIVPYGLFGPLHLTHPAATPSHTVLFFSDRDGWTARQDRLSGSLASQGALVVGIDLASYLGELAGLHAKCAYPAGHVEEVAHWIERHEGLAGYEHPLVVGDGSGATFAYALVAQAPAGTFAGLVTLGWDAAWTFPQPFCAGDAGAMTAPAAAGGFRVVPVAKLPERWIAEPFAPGARASGWLADARVAVRAAGAMVPMLASRDDADELADAYDAWRAGQTEARVALPDDVADLPITDLAPHGKTTHRIAIMITGDGGWAGLDRGVADALTGDGVRVIGFSSLKFFWHRKTPDEAAEAIARVIAHYGKSDPGARFVLIGYSFGASLVPVVANRLPDDAKARVDGGVMISPDDEAVFEIHVGDWFGSTKHDDALPVAPEVASAKIPLVCVHGRDENDSYCLKPQPANVRVVDLPGAHHYDGDYAALGRLIVETLPKAL